MLYRSVADLDFALDDLQRVNLPENVLLTSPEFFDIQYVINPHMAAHVGKVDYARALLQWQKLTDAYERIGLNIHVMEGKPGLPDMVFCANQTLPFLSPMNGRRGVVLSEMHSEERRPEVEYFKDFFHARGYQTMSLGENPPFKFEGMGDALWHSGRFLLWGGFGFRTSDDAYAMLAESLQVPIILLELTDPDFYHLDTCLSILDESTALIFPGAFKPEGLELLRTLFPRLIEAPEDEARIHFACNAHCPDRMNVLIQRFCEKTVNMLIDADFGPIELDTSEFIKSGGSVFCMKQMFW